MWCGMFILCSLRDMVLRFRCQKRAATSIIVVVIVVTDGANFFKFPIILDRTGLEAGRKERKKLESK